METFEIHVYSIKANNHYSHEKPHPLDDLPASLPLWSDESCLNCHPILVAEESPPPWLQAQEQESEPSWCEYA